MNACLQIVTAIDLAACWHREQRKKGTEEPYIYHLVEVAALVTRATDGEDPNLAVAAILHEAVEHQDVPIDSITAGFGDDIAGLVAEMTVDKSLPDDKRNARQINAAGTASQRAKLLHLADRISNHRALVAKPPPDWSVRRRLTYVSAAREFVTAMGPVHAGLQGLFETAARQAEAQLLPVDSKVQPTETS
jgi:(p)ppGpp synthase/HD superfamily hydrolase